MNESQCPFPHAGATLDLNDLPPRIAKLPQHRGFPVPWFVGQVDGEYDFRLVGPGKFWEAVRQKKCWICGERLGQWISFVIGPMCGVTHTSAEPPSHRLCARFAALHCPFLTRPKMKRREDEVTQSATPAAGVSLDRNPGVCAIWTVRDYTVFRDHNGRPLIDIGEAVEVEWYACGRPATRAEVQASIDSGLPFLRELCDTEDTPEECTASHAELDRRLAGLQILLPGAAPEPEEQAS